MFGKPSGFWVSVKGKCDWLHFCRTEQWSLGRYQYDVIVNPDARILHLEGEKDLDTFTSLYSVPDRYIGDTIINWVPVAEKYQGILIYPYVWSRRLWPHYRWYYTWDVASGCIWDASAIAGIKLVK